MLWIDRWTACSHTLQIAAEIAMDARQLTLLWNSFHFQEELQREKALRVELEMRLEKANAAASIAGGSYSSEAPVAGEARIRTLQPKGR